MHDEDAIKRRLIRDGQSLLDRPRAPIEFTGDIEPDALLNDLEHSPHAFVMGCLVDRQVPAERAWRLPFEACQRLGTTDVTELGKLTEDEWVACLEQDPSLHRFPAAMGRVLHRGIQRINSSHGGDASRIWSDRPSSARLVRRFLEFHGAGPKIACMAANILIRDFRIPLRDYRYIDISADVQVRRVMARLGIVESGSSPDVVIYAAREMNPDFPGIFDLILWEIGRNYCHPSRPACESCVLNGLCPSAARESTERVS